MGTRAAVASAPVAAGRLDGLDGPGLLALVREALGRLGQEPLSGAVDDGALATSVTGLHRIETIAHAEKLRRVAELDRRSAHLARGARTTADMLAAQLGLTRGEARTTVSTARALERLPETADRLRRGEIGIGQAQVAGRALDDLDRATPDPDDASRPEGNDMGADGDGGGGQGSHGDKTDHGTEGDNGAGAAGDSADVAGAGDSGAPGEASGLVTALDKLVAKEGGERDRAQLRRRVDEWSHTRGADRLADQERRAHAERRVWLGRDRADGSWILEGRLDPVGGAKLQAALDALSRRTDADDDRTFRQRRADALVELATRVLEGGGLPQTTAQRPHVLLITTAEAQAGHPDAAPADLDGYGPVSTETAQLIFCDAETTTVVTDRNGAVLDVGRTRRDPTPRQRAAVITRDRRCVGCGAPASRSEIHHIDWWSHGGRTDLSNLCLLCWNCHHHVHQHGWQVIREGTGGFRVERPSGEGAFLRHTA